LNETETEEDKWFLMHRHLKVQTGPSILNATSPLASLMENCGVHSDLGVNVIITISGNFDKFSDKKIGDSLPGWPDEIVKKWAKT
jgi:hypothetical protein